MNKTLIILFSLFLCFGCSSRSKKQFGITETMPDEYKVQRNKALEVPPSYQKRQIRIEQEKAILSKKEQALLKEIK